MRFKIDETGKLLKVEKLGKRNKVVKVPDGVTSIGKSAFSYCDNIKEVILPSSVKKIERYAFTNNKGIEKINIPSSVEEIGDDAFSNCENLKKIVIPESVTTIGKNVFYKCHGLKTVVLPKNLKRIETGTFNGCSSLENINLPKGLEKIEDYVFCQCESLKKIELPKTVKRIGKCGFCYCMELSEIDLPEGLESIGAFAFEECISLTSINIPKSVKKIENKAFSLCHGIRKVSIPDTIESLTNNAFSGTNNISEFTFSDKKTINLKKLDMFKNQNIQNLFSSEEKLDSKYLDVIDTSMGTYIDMISSSIYLSSLLNLEDIRNSKELSILIPFMAERLFCKETALNMINEFKNNKKEFNKIMKRLLEQNNSLSLSNRMNYYDLFKFSYSIGAFSDNQVDRQKACEFISNILNKGYINFNNMHSVMDSLNVKQFNKEWSEFIMDKKNFAMLLELEQEQSGYISRIYNSFNEIKEFGRRNRGNQNYRKVTVDMCLSYLSRINFDNVDETNRDIVNTIKAYTKSQESFDMADSIRKIYLKLREENKIEDHILGEPLKEKDVFEQIDEERINALNETKDTLDVLNDLANKRFTYEFLSKYDPRNFILGKYCSCCAHLEGVGSSIMRASILHPDCQNLVIKNKEGKIIAKSTLYINKKQGYGVFNNVEINLSVIDEKSKEMIYKKYMEAINAFASKYNEKNPENPIKQINVGMNLNDLHDQIIKNNKKSSILAGLDFSKYGKYAGDWKEQQYVLWSNEEKKIRK